MSELTAPPVQNVRALLLTDGKMGDLAQCRGVAQALGAATTEVRVKPSKLHAMAGKLGRDGRFEDAIDALATPPDCIIASGRRTVPYLKALKAKWGASTLTVFLKDPRTGTGTADIIWVPAHDGLRGDNVVVTDMAPHSHTQAARDEAAKTLTKRLAGYPRPWLGVLLGGVTTRVPYDRATQTALSDAIAQASQQAGSVIITPSRRTPEALITTLETIHPNCWIWDEQGQNPYPGMLGACDALLVTGDSHNMVSEALAAGRHTMVFRPKGLPGKFERFLNTLEGKGLITGPQPAKFGHQQEQVDAAPTIAEAIKVALNG